MSDELGYLLLAGVGFVASIVNVFAGGGSFLTLPLLIFLGLPAPVANGTNRIGVVMQSVTSVWGFHRHGVVDWRWTLIVLVPGIAGVVLGARAALEVGDEAFRRILAILMLVLTLWTLLAHRAEREVRSSSPPLLPAMLAFVFIGLYAGFIQAGIGFLVLAITSLAGMDLMRGNAVKMLVVLVFTLISLIVFLTEGSVDWPMGLALGTGNALGGWVGVRIAVTKGQRWFRGVLVAAVSVFAVRLWFS